MKKGYFENDIKQLKKKNSWQDKMGVKIAKVGVLPVPLALYRFKRDLGFNYSQIAFIGFVLLYTQNGKLPYFSLAKLNRDFGFPPDTLNRIIKKLREKGYLKTTPRKENPKGKGRNEYDISELIKTLESLIDANKEKLFNTKSWTPNDILDYGLMHEHEEQKTQNRSDKDTKTVEHNK